jgi:hypothetical protein
MSRLSILDVFAIFILAVAVITALVLGVAYYPDVVAVLTGFALFMWAISRVFGILDRVDRDDR